MIYQLIGNNLQKSLGERKVLDSIDVKISGGEIVALIGPSGCGKTTLLRCISLLSPPDSGNLQIGDLSFDFSQSVNPPWGIIYPELTAVFQQFALWPHLQVRENLTLPLKLRGMYDSDEDIQMLCVELGLEMYLDRFPAQLSVGQRQRVAFARALLLKPKYLLLDEITSAQDVEHIKRIIAIIRKIAAEGTCIFLATHLIGFARRVASRFYFIDHGRIVEDGTTESLTNPKSERLKDFLLIGDEL